MTIVCELTFTDPIDGQEYFSNFFHTPFCKTQYLAWEPDKIEKQISDTESNILHYKKVILNMEKKLAGLRKGISGENQEVDFG